jgi:hypothetical protein
MARKIISRNQSRAGFRTSSDAGFTLLELVVSLGVAAVMFLMIDRIFNETQRAVTAGIKTGETMVKAETIGDQFQSDAEIMLGPGGAVPNRGCLIISQKMYPFVPVLDNAPSQFLEDDPNYVPPAPFLPALPGPVGRREHIRSDQIVFFVDGELTDGSSRKISTLTPARQDTLATRVERQFRYGRVWYGHARVTRPDGTTITPTVPPALPATEPADFGSVDSAENLYANRWILGRQNLLFRAPSDPYTFSPSEIYCSYTVSSPDPKPVTTIGSMVSEYNSKLYQAQTDFCFQDLNTVWDYVSSSNYPNDVYGFSYFYNKINAPNKEDSRLWVNRALTGGQQTGAREFLAGEMAKLHALLSANVSDFIVDFAGDYDGTTPGVIDVTTAAPLATDYGGRRYAIPADSIKWYGYWSNDPVTGFRRDPRALNPSFVPPTTVGDPLYDEYNIPSPPPGFAKFRADLPIIYEIPSAAFVGTQTNVPPALPASPEAYLQASATTPALDTTLYANADAVLVFRHDDTTAGTNKWPYLLRIRYRLHDDNGVIAGVSDAGEKLDVNDTFAGPGGTWRNYTRRTMGKWYEHIIRVPRP